MATISFGNLTVKEMENIQGIVLSSEDRDNLESMRQDNADVQEGKFHIFKYPFVVDCGDEETANKVIAILTPHADDMSVPMQVVG
jgi:hypothetical protein